MGDREFWFWLKFGEACRRAAESEPIESEGEFTEAGPDIDVYIVRAAFT